MKQHYTINLLDKSIDLLLPEIAAIKIARIRPNRPALLQMVAVESFVRGYNLLDPKIVYAMGVCRSAMNDLHLLGQFTFIRESEFQELYNIEPQTQEI